MSPRRRSIVFLTVVIGIVFLLVIVFGTGSKDNNENTPIKSSDKKVLDLVEYTERDSKVVLTIDGRINGDDVHRSVRISVGPHRRRAEVIQGYQNNVIKSQDFDNNRTAYNDFMRALAKTGFGKERKNITNDERGFCAEGQRYIFEIYDNNDQVSRTWSSNCVKGSADVEVNTVLQLFKAQVTDYGRFINNVTL